MELKNYWLLLIWMFIMGAAALIFNFKHTETEGKQKVVRWHIVPALLLAAPYAVWAGWRSTSWGDTAVYKMMFRNAPDSIAELRQFLETQSKDRGYAALTVLFKSVFGDANTLYFLIIASFELMLLVYMYRRYSRDYWLSMFFFVASADYLSWFHNGMRQFIAAALIFACVPWVAKKKYIPAVLVILAASTFHTSALIALPMIFVVQGRPWNWKTILFGSAIVAAIVLIDDLSMFIGRIMDDTVYSGEIEEFIEDDGTNILRVAFYSVPTLLTLMFRKRVLASKDPIIWVCTNMCIISTGLYVISYFTSGILMGRLPIYFSLAGYIVIPWILDEVFTKDSSRFLKAGFIAVYSFWFYYQVGIAWGLL